MKRTFFALAFLTTVVMVPFNRAETPSQENSSEEAWRQITKGASFTIPVRNEGTASISPFVIARYTYADESYNEVKVQGESLLPGQNGTIFVNVEPSAENPVISVDITAIGCETFSQNLSLSQQEAENSIFIIRDTEWTLYTQESCSAEESQETGN